MGMMIALPILFIGNLSSIPLSPGYFLLPLPAIVDFTTHELKLQKSNNTIRLITGIFLGSFIGFGIYHILEGVLLIGFFSLVWLIILEFIVVLILKWAGRLEKFIQRYEEAIRKTPES